MEFGATNGIDLSNTYTLEDKFSWSGALAEPDINWIESLKKNRTKSKIITKCIWSKSGKKMNFFSSKVGVLSTLDDFKNSDIKSMPGNTALRVKEGVNIEVETTNDDLLPFLLTIPIQKLAYYSALKKGYDIDKPRNLAKSVTVE